MNPSRLCTVQGATSRICGVAKLSLLRFSDLETRQYNRSRNMYRSMCVANKACSREHNWY
jgi:hypothetical protein